MSHPIGRRDAEARTKEKVVDADRKYAYESHQDSILRPYYQRYLWNAILGALPQAFSPNAMTVISTLCAGVSFVLAATMVHSPPALVLAGALILSYVTLDNLDGAHARRTGRSSRLGEFLDHWLDTVNTGFVTGGACLAAGLDSGFIVAVLLCGALAFFAVQWELARTGVFRMGRVGDIEGNTMVALLYWVIALLGPESLSIRPLDGLPTLAVMIGLGVMGQALATVASAVSRVRSDLVDFIPITLAHGLVLLWAWPGGIDARIFLPAAMLLNPVFTTRPIFGRVLGRADLWLEPAALGLLVLGLAAALWAPAAGNLFGVLANLGLAGLTVRSFGIALIRLRD